MSVMCDWSFFFLTLIDTKLRPSLMFFSFEYFGANCLMILIMRLKFIGSPFQCIISSLMCTNEAENLVQFLLDKICMLTFLLNPPFSLAIVEFCSECLFYLSLS